MVHMVLEKKYENIFEKKKQQIKSSDKQNLTNVSTALI